jgi:hypothetical protein
LQEATVHLKFHLNVDPTDLDPSFKIAETSAQTKSGCVPQAERVIAKKAGQYSDGDVHDDDKLK